MDLKTIDKQEKPLLSRTEIKAELNFTGPTPSNEDLKKALAKQLKADENLIVIKHIYTAFGISKATATAYVYNSKKEMENIEPDTQAGTPTKSDSSHRDSSLKKEKKEKKPKPKPEPKTEEKPKTDTEESKPAPKEEPKEEKKEQAKSEDKKSE